MAARMVHDNARNDRSCGSVPAQTPTMSAHIIRVKHTRPGLAIQAVGEPWESLAEYGPQQNERRFSLRIVRVLRERPLVPSVSVTRLCFLVRGRA